MSRDWRHAKARAIVGHYEQARLVIHSDGRQAMRMGEPGPAEDSRWVEVGPGGLRVTWLHDWDMALIRAPIVH